MSPHTASGSGGEAGGAAAAHELEAEEEFEDVSDVNPLTAVVVVADVGEPEVEEDDLGYTAAGPRRTDNRKRKTERKSTKCTYAPIAGCQGLTREETNAKLFELSQRECCGGSWGGRDDLSPLGGNVWRGRTDRSTKAVREYYRMRRCCFYRESDCCYVIQETYDVATGTFSLSRAGVHSDHTQSNWKAGLPLYLQLKMSSPSKLALSHAERAKQMRREVGASFDSTMQKQFRGQTKKKKRTFGGASTWAAGRSKAAMEAKGDFGMHTVYVCGEARINSIAQEIAIAISSENLLLNGYRQSISSVPTHVQVDTTYRLVLEGHNNMLIGCVDTRQRFHTIGYGICGEEDTAAHTFIMKCLKDEMEAVV
uniref:Uncharacterized protein n=1 Tax=Coccolithus braarudii TaxID=221442 RepID=A0A7S0LG11_9EUKA